MSEVELNISAGKKIKGKITETGIDYATVVFEENNLLETLLDYEVGLLEINKKIIRIRLVNDGLDFIQSEKLMGQIITEESLSVFCAGR